MPLVRACISEDAIHENPDGKIIKGPHIHLYKEGHRDNIAYPITEVGFDSHEIAKFLAKFLEYCSIERIKIIDQKILTQND